jgi:phage-related protein
VTTPTGPIVGVASVAITPSTAAFNQQLQAGLQRAREAVSDAADAMGDSIANQITAGATRARLALEAMTAGVNDRLNVTVSVSKSVVGGLLSVGSTATKAGAGIGALGLALGNVAFTLGAVLGAASELSGVLIGLPAVVGSAALVMGTFKVAMDGVGEAMSAAVSGDADALVAAMAELTPAAQQAVQSIVKLRPRINELKDATQQNFFAPMIQSFGAFSTQAVGLAENALPRISTELGTIGNEFLTVASRGTFFTGLRALVDQTVSGLQRWRGVMGEVADALGNLFQVGSGFAGDMIAGVGVLIEQFATWVNTAAQTGELQARLQTALDAFAQLGRIVMNTADIFGAFWFAAQEAGASFLGVIERLTEQFATFLNSDAGIESLTALMNAGATAAAILGDAVGALLPVVGELVLAFSEALVGALQEMKPGLDALIEGLGFFAQEAAGGVSSAIGTLATSFGDIMNAVAPLLPVLGEIVGMLAEHFAVTLSLVAGLLNSFLTALQPLLPEIQAIIASGLETFTLALMALMDAVTPLLPVILDLAVNVLQLFATVLTTVFQVLEPFLPMLTDLATKVLTMVSSHFEHLITAIEPLVPVIIDLISKGFEILAEIIPIVVDALAPLLPIIADIARELFAALAPSLPIIVDGFKKIFEALKPVLPQLAELAGDLLVGMAQLFVGLVQAILPIVPPLIQIGTEILSVLIPAFNQLLQAVLPVLPVLSQLAVQVLRDALLPVIQAILPVLPILIDAFIKLLPSLVDLLPPLVQIALALTPIIVLLADVATVIIQVLLPPILLIMVTLTEFRAITLTLLAIAIDALALTFKIAWDVIVTAVQVAWTILKGIFDTIISLLQGDFTEAWQTFKRMIGEVWSEISGLVSRTIATILQNLKDWGLDIWNAVWNALTNVAGIFSTKFAEMVTTVGDKMLEILSSLSALPGAVGLIFLDAVTWLYDSGKNVIQGFINGLTATAQDLYNKLQEIVNKAKELWDGVTGWITGSPSRWMTQRGKWVVQGFAEGLEAEQSVAVDATQALLNATKRPFEASLTGPTPNISSLLGAAPLVPSGVMAGSSGTTLTVTFGEGAVVVSFEGVVPSEADALKTGQAVGRGILDVIAERDARLAVRVL